MFTPDIKTKNLEQDSRINLQSMSEECQRLVNLKPDTAQIEEPEIEMLLKQ